jgi:hypothetical protein
MIPLIQPTFSSGSNKIWNHTKEVEVRNIIAIVSESARKGAEKSTAQSPKPPLCEIVGTGATAET